MKRTGLIFTMVLISLSLLLGGCGEKEKGKVLKVGVYQTSPYVIAQGFVAPSANNAGQAKNPTHLKQKFTGFDIELMDAIAKKMGVELEFIDNSFFSDMFAGVKNKTYDLAIGDISITEERQKEYAFSEPYLESGNCLVVFRGDSIKSAENLAGKNIGALSGTTTMIDKANTLPGAKVVPFNTDTDMYMALFNGDIDGIIMDKKEAAYAIAKKQLKRAEIAENFSAESLAILLNKDNKELQNNINKALKEFKDSGEYQALCEKWFGKEPATAKPAN